MVDDKNITIQAFEELEAEINHHIGETQQMYEDITRQSVKRKLEYEVDMSINGDDERGSRERKSAFESLYSFDKERLERLEKDIKYYQIKLMRLKEKKDNYLNGK